MNLKILFVVSLALNVLLGAYVLRKPATPPPAATAPSAPALPAKVAVPKVQVVEQTITNTLVKRFGWDSVESPDYKQYIANLRSVGCPEETIRDIIIADVNKLYDQKKKQVRGQPKKYEFWKPGNPMFGAMNSEVMEKLRALDEEKNSVLRALGIEPDFKSQVASMMNPLDAMFDFLPEAKKTQILKVMTDMQAKMAKAMEGGGQPDRVELVKAQKEMEQAVKQMLTPEEALAFDLRLSTTANMMRMQSGGFDPTEEEFLKVFKLRKAFDDEYSPMTRGEETDEQRKRREAAEKQLKEQIKESLGAERYADYERPQNWSYQQIYGAAKKAELGTDAANQVYAMKKAAEQKVTELRNNKNLSADERNAALAAIQQETQKSMQQVLGDKGWDQYNRGYNTSWLKNMVPKPPKSTDK